MWVQSWCEIFRTSQTPTRSSKCLSPMMSNHRPKIPDSKHKAQPTNPKPYINPFIFPVPIYTYICVHTYLYIYIYVFVLDFHAHQFLYLYALNPNPAAGRPSFSPGDRAGEAGSATVVVLPALGHWEPRNKNLPPP